MGLLKVLFEFLQRRTAEKEAAEREKLLKPVQYLACELMRKYGLPETILLPYCRIPEPSLSPYWSSTFNTRLSKKDVRALMVLRVSPLDFEKIITDRGIKEIFFTVPGWNRDAGSYDYCPYWFNVNKLQIQTEARPDSSSFFDHILNDGATEEYIPTLSISRLFLK